MKSPSISVIFLTSVLSIGTAAAQGLDYGKYETLFGEPVTESATGKPERVTNSPVIMDVITAADIQRSGAQDIPTLLSRLAGIDVVHSSPGQMDLGSAVFCDR